MQTHRHVDPPDSAFADAQACRPMSPETATRLLEAGVYAAHEPTQRRLAPDTAVISLARVACVAIAVAAAAALVLAAAPRVLS